MYNRVIKTFQFYWMTDSPYLNFEKIIPVNKIISVQC